ncbi:hypothetical protein AAA294_07205 [Fusobacterium varium]|uniref:hypothetical protein n=1 Tax=Fusobacterium varium TaxID=856 RepID=UPI0032BF45AC
MGLDMRTKNGNSFGISYSGFMGIRLNIAEAYDREKYELYRICMNRSLTKKEFKKIYFGDLQEFLFHSDCDGILKLCTIRKTLKELEKLDIEGYPWKSEIKQMMEFFREAIKEKQRIYFE